MKSVYTSFFFGSLPTLSPSPFQGSLLVGIAYVIGYAVQDLLSLTRLVTTSTRADPYRYVQWLYKLFIGVPWKKPKVVLSRAQREWLYVYASEQSLSELRRMIFLKHIGATMGSSWFLCAILLFVKFYLSKIKCFELIEGLSELSLSKSELLWIAIGLAVLSIGLIELAKVKSEQQKLFMSDLYDEVQKKKEGEAQKTKESKDSANQSQGSSSNKTGEEA